VAAGSRIGPCDQSALRAGAHILTTQVVIRPVLVRPSHPSLPFLRPHPLPSSPPTPFIMGSLSPPPMRHRASSTNLRPALTLATLGPRPKTCTLLDPIPGTPPVTADIHKVAPSLASPSRLSLLIERCLVLLHVYSHLPPYSTPSSPRSPSEESVLPMSSTAASFGDDVEEIQGLLPSPSPSRSWFQSTPSVCWIFHTSHASAHPTHHRLIYRYYS